MKLKTRLTISFLIIIFVPVLLGSATLIFLHAMENAGEGKEYDISGNLAWSDNSVKLLVHYANLEQNKVTNYIKLDTARAVNVSDLVDFNEKIRKEGYSYLMVREGRRLIFDGSGKDHSIQLSELPSYGANSETDNILLYLKSGRPALLRQIDFISPVGEYCTAFLVTTSSTIMPETRRIYVDMIISILMILFITAVVLVGFIYKSIVPRIRELSQAADEIREGNLDKPLKSSYNDEIGELYSAFEDMRQRLSRTAKEKTKSEEEQKILISNIAHDLKTPITAVKGYAEGLIDGVANTPVKRDQYMKTILAKANEMNSLINELTLYSRIDTDRVPYNFTPINVSDFFLDCSEEIGMDLKNQGITFFYYNYTDDGTMIVADPEQLERVVHNIISNSVKYMADRPGVITLRVKDAGGFVQVEISDNGRGISPEALPHIFERMYRADSSRNSKISGSGIGLSIVKKIVEDHGGSIWASSKVDVGTVIYFVLRKYEEGK